MEGETRETVPAQDAAAAPLTLDIRMTEEEIRRCLEAGVRRAGKGRVIAETVVLLVLTVYCIVAYFLDESRQLSSLLLALIALAVVAALWIVPPVRFRSLARREAEEGKTVRLILDGDTLRFGAGETPVEVPASRCRPIWRDELLVLEISGELVGVPRRVTGEDGWQRLCAVFPPEQDSAR